MEKADYQQAIVQLTALDGYKNSQELIQECHYQTAIKILADGNYTEAQNILKTLGDYKDAKEQIQECKYQAALALLEKGEIVKGYDALIALKDYKDSAAKAKEVKKTYNRIKAKSKIFVNQYWKSGGGKALYYLDTKKKSKDKVEIFVYGWLTDADAFNDVMTCWEITGKWDATTGRLTYTNAKRYRRIGNKTYNDYKNGTGYFYYENGRLYWVSNNDKEVKNCWFSEDLA